MKASVCNIEQTMKQKERIRYKSIIRRYQISSQGAGV